MPSPSPISISPFLQTLYVTLLTETLHRLHTVQTGLGTHKTRGHQQVEAVMQQIDQVTAQQELAGSEVDEAGIQALYSRRVELGKAVSGMAILDAALDNQLFRVGLTGKKVNELRDQMEGFGAQNERKEEGEGEPGDGEGEWDQLVKKVTHVADEAHRVADEMEEMWREEEQKDDHGDMAGLDNKGASEGEKDSGTGGDEDVGENQGQNVDDHEERDFSGGETIIIEPQGQHMLL